MVILVLVLVLVWGDLLVRRSVAVVVVVFSFFLALGGVGWRRSRELVRATGGGGGAGASGCNHCLANIFVQNVLIQFLSCMRAPSVGKHNSATLPCKYLRAKRFDSISILHESA